MEPEDDMIRSLMEYMREDGEQKKEEHFQAVIQDLLQRGQIDPKLVPSFRVDIELQPFRWIESGRDLIQSAKGTLSIQYAGGVSGPPMNAYLTYPVFQMGTEIFLKGMWLCQFEECRRIAERDWIAADRRKYYQRHIQKLGHDILGIIEAVRQIPQFDDSVSVCKFLDILQAIIRQHYFPFYESERRSRDWADARYPKRFYNDAEHQAQADSFQRYPEQGIILRIFSEAADEVERIWKLRSNLVSRELE